MDNSNTIAEIYQKLTQKGRKGSLKKIAEIVGCSRQNVSLVLRGQSVNETVVLAAAKYLMELEEKSAQTKSEVSELVKRSRQLYVQTAEINGEY